MTDGAEHHWDAFASDYDRFTAHFDYDAWTSSLEALAREHGLAGTRLLDVACGTGKSFAPFLERGWEVVGCDISSRMLEVAERRAGGRARLLHRDMRELEVVGEFDLVLMINDALNYVTTDADVAAAVAAAAANLAEGGILVLDVNTLLLYRSMYASTTVLEDENTVFVWRGQTPADLGPRGDVRATLDTFGRQDDDRWTRSTVVHVQRHHPAEVIDAAVAAAGLRTLAVHGQDLMGTVHREIDPATHAKTILVVGH